MTGYKSIFAGKAAPKSVPTAIGGYQSIFAKPKTIGSKDIAAGALKSAQIANRVYQSISQSPAPRKGLARVLTDISHAGSAAGRFVGTGTAKLANTAIEGGRQIGYTVEMLAANRHIPGTNINIPGKKNPTAFANANRASQTNYEQANKDHSGILGVGTIFKNAQEAKSGNLKTVSKRIGGGTLQAAGELVPFAKGLRTASEVYRVAGRTPIAESLLKKALQNAALGSATGAAGDAGNQLLNTGKVNVKQLLKSAAAGGVIGGGASILSHAIGAVGKKVTGDSGVAFNSGEIGKLAKAPSRKVGGNLDVKNPEFNQSINKAPEFTKQIESALNKVKVSSKSSHMVKGALGELQSLLTPGKGTKAVQNDLRAATGKLALDTGVERQAAKDTVKFFAKKNPNDNLNFIQKIQSGAKQATPELQRQADNFRKGFEEDYQLAKSIKPDVPYLENYFAQSGVWKDPTAADAFVKRFQKATLGGKPGALEARQFPTLYDGIKFGLVPKESNPAVIALNNRTSLLKAKMAQDFLEEQASKGIDPEISQKVVQRYLDPGLQGSDLYKSARGAAYALNSLQLALSGFHVTGTALNATFSEFANGLKSITKGNILKGGKELAGSTTAPIKYILNGNRIVKDLRAGNITKDISNIAEGGGRIGRQPTYEATGLAKSLQEFRSGSAKEFTKGALAAPFRAVNDAARPIMDWWVPRIKAGAAKSLIDRKLSELGPNASQEAIRAAKSEAIDSIDNRFGQLVQDNLFWNQKVKDISTVLARSPGWNIGTVREVGGGAKDLLTKTARGNGLSERSSYTLSLAAGTALIGTALSYLYTGKPPQNPIDYFYPKTGKVDKNGNDERVSLPTYAKDIFAFTHNPGGTVANKANPLISIGNNLRTNKDYYGNQVHNPNDSVGTQLKQTGQFLTKNLLPFSVTGANQRTEKNLNTKVQSFFGLNPAPGYITKSGFQQSVEKALNHAIGSKSLTPQEAKVLADKASQPKTGTALSRQFDYLAQVDRAAAARLVSKAGPDDIKKLGDLSQLIIKLGNTTTNFNAKQFTRETSGKLLDALNKANR